MKPQLYVITERDNADNIIIQAAHDWDKYPDSTKVVIDTKAGEIHTYLVSENAVYNPGITDLCQLVPIEHYNDSEFVIAIKNV